MVGAKCLLADGQGTLVEGFGLLVLALAVVESCQVVEAGGGVGMVGAKRLLTDGQGALVERFGLLILALALVESCQVVEVGGGVGMVGAKCLLADGQGALVEGFGFRILGAFMEVECGLIEETGRFRKCEPIPLNKRDTSSCMRKQAFTLGPGGEVYMREGLIESAYGALCPYPSCGFIHVQKLCGLHQSMERNGAFLTITADEREARERPNGLVQLRRVVLPCC